MKRKYEVTVNGQTCIIIEAWTPEEALRIALRDFIALSSNMKIGQTDTVTIERMA